MGKRGYSLKQRLKRHSVSHNLHNSSKFKLKLFFMFKSLLFILLLPLFCLSQTTYVDSLSDATYNHPNSNDSIQMHNYVLLVRAHIANKTNDSILPVSLKAIAFAKKTNNPEYLASAYNLKAVYYKANNEFNESLAIFNTAYYYSKQINKPKRIQCVVYHNLYQTQEKLGKLDSSFYYAEKGYEKAIEIKDSMFQSTTLNGMASYYMKIGAYERAIENLNKSLKIAVLRKDTLHIIRVNIDIGKVLADNNKHEELIELYNQLLINYDSINLAPSMDLINLNMGASYNELKKHNKALEYSYKVLNSKNRHLSGLAHENIGAIILTQLENGVPESEILLLNNINSEKNLFKPKHCI